MQRILKSEKFSILFLGVFVCLFVCLAIIPCAVQYTLVAYIFHLFLIFYLFGCMHACWVASVVCNSWQTYGLQPARFLSMGLSRQEYRSGLPCPLPGDLPNPGIKPASLHWQVGSLPLTPPGKPLFAFTRSQLGSMWTLSRGVWSLVPWPGI